MLENLKAGKFDEISKSVSTKVSDLLDCEPITSLISHAGTDPIQMYVEAEIIKLAGMLNINPALNIKAAQVPVIAQTLLETYKWESLEDFTLCFRKAAAGLYGEIYRVDGAVIGIWMSRYLDEKYDALEQRKAKEKHADKNVDLSKIAKEAEAEYGPGTEKYKQAEKMAADLIASIQDKPKDNAKENRYQREKLNYTPTHSEEQVKKVALHNRYLHENYNMKTGEKLYSWLPEEEWLKNLK